MPEEAKQPSESINQNEISQKEMIELLQKTIGQLEVIVNKLSTESMDNLPPREVVETLSTNTEVLTELLGETKTSTSTTPGQPEAVTPSDFTESENLFPEILFNEEDIDLEEPTEPVRVDPATLSSNGLENWWDRILNNIRSVLPTALSDKLSNWAITGIVSTVVVGVLLSSVLWVSRPSPKIAQTPTSTVTPLPTETPTPTITPAPTSEEIETPLEIEAPGNPEPVQFAPPPKPELTPEQSLIASIQEQVSDLTRQYPEGLIATIEANFLGSRLIVTMGNEWYSLDKSRQNNLANAIFERSRRLDFRKLELMDQQGNLIARSPVVGEEMVILQREKDLKSTT